MGMFYTAYAIQTEKLGNRDQIRNQWGHLHHPIQSNQAKKGEEDARKMKTEIFLSTVAGV